MAGQSNTSLKELNVINAISMLFGGIAGVYTLISMLTAVLNAKDLGEGEFRVITILVAVALTTIAIAVVVRMVSLALMVFATRGPKALDWAWPSECVSKESWLACSWNFAGRNGRQEGMRFFGLGIALKGDHDKSVINAFEPAAQ
jgi:hypothetical protein